MNVLEQKMWRKIRPRLQALSRYIKVVRIETGKTTRGVADLYCRHSGRSWIELKFATESNGKYDLTHFSAAQREFLEKEDQLADGGAWLLIEAEDLGWFLIEGKNAELLPKRPTARKLKLAATIHWDHINVKALVSVITGDFIPKG